jgi:hypothetical protein
LAIHNPSFAIELQYWLSVYLRKAYTIDDAADQLSNGRVLLDEYPNKAEIWMRLIRERLSAAFNDS